MKGKQKRIWITACAALTWAMCAHTVWAAGGHWEYRDENNQWFYLNEKGLVVICNPYLVTAYAGGKIEIEVPYQELEEVMNELYVLK